MGRILVVDDEEGLRNMLAVALRRDEHEVVLAASGREALAQLEDPGADVLLTDLRMDDIDGLELVARTRAEHPHTFIIAMTAYAEWDTAVKAMRLGAYNFLNKPFDNDVLRAHIRRALNAREHFIAAKEAGESHVGVHLIGATPPIQQVQERIEQVSTTDSTVLILGESGVGKELVARAVHYSSLRSDGPLVRVNSGALAPSLLESELFGHVKGAFTGAVEDRPGLFELADGGTLFLDEAGDLAMETQTKILRVLEAGEYLPVGGTQVKHCDVRVVAATNKHLKSMVAAGSFREDLYYRLAVIAIELPPLRARREDIPLLAGHLLSRHAVRLRHGVTGFTEQAMEAMQTYSWPGNVRELDNRVQRGVALTPEGVIGFEALFEDMADTTTGMWRKIRFGDTAMRPKSASAPSPALEARPGNCLQDIAQRVERGEAIDLEAELRAAERALVAAAISATDNNLTDAAKLLELSFRQIRYKAKQLGLR